MDDYLKINENLEHSSRGFFEDDAGERMRKLRKELRDRRSSSLKEKTPNPTSHQQEPMQRNSVIKSKLVSMMGKVMIFVQRVKKQVNMNKMVLTEANYLMMINDASHYFESKQEYLLKSLVK